MAKSHEERFKRCFDNMLDCCVIFQPKRNHLGEIVDLIYEEVNESACIHTGLTKEQQMGKGMLEVNPGHKNTGLFEKYCQVIETGKSLEITDLKYDGDIAISAAYEIRAIKIDDGITIFWRNVTVARRVENAPFPICEDITEKKRYESLMTNMTDGFAYCRMIYENGEPEDFIYLTVNIAFTKLTGLKDVIGKRVTEVIPGIKEAIPELLEIYGRVARTGLSERFEKYIGPVNAWLSISASSFGDGNFMVIFDNITERKRMEQALNESVTRYRMLFENVNDAVFLLELDAAGKLVCFREVNDVACRRLGIERNLGKLLRYETKKKSEYLLTLEALLESNNLTDTANKLFVHQKTLNFRKGSVLTPHCFFLLTLI